MTHVPVLLPETITGLALAEGQTIVDATVNRGGHSKLISDAIGREGYLIGIDADAEAIAEARTQLKNCPSKVSLVVRNFRQLDQVLDELRLKQVDAFLFDLGLSSNQLDGSNRGFSFSHGEQPLSMSFNSQDTPGKLTAHEIVNNWREESLVDIIYGYGEEHFSRRIAKAIVEARKLGPIATTNQLVEVIRGAVPVWYTHKRLHFATKTFQALRITVNDELGAIKEGLTKAWKHLKPGGRIAVISFHSLEARLVKTQFKSWVESGAGELVTRKTIKPSRAEELVNPRSRSAQLKIIKKYDH
jgi:16S rRNA (cytosine1402-N4)-methyltransferase